MAGPDFTPFENDMESVGYEGLTVENGLDAIALYGQIRLTRDREGLRRALWLRDFADAVVARLSAEKDLPDSVDGPKPTGSMKNPFA
jgi:hypothetical protein